MHLALTNHCSLFQSVPHIWHVHISSSRRKKKLAEVEKHEKLAPHPNCVQFYRAWEERHRLYIQIELCLMSLSECADLHGRLGNAVATKFLVDLIKVDTSVCALTYTTHTLAHTYIHVHMLQLRISSLQNGCHECQLTHDSL